MLTKEGWEFILHITDYFHGHWEDPEWGRRPSAQILVHLALHELAGAVADRESREQIAAITERGVKVAAQEMVKAR